MSKAEVSKIPDHIKKLRPLGTVDWSREAYTFGISGRPPHFKSHEPSISVLNKTRHSAVMLSNQNDIKYTFKDTIEKHCRMYARRAFVYMFVGEGMESGEFSEKLEDLVALT